MTDTDTPKIKCNFEVTGETRSTKLGQQYRAKCSRCGTMIWTRSPDVSIVFAWCSVEPTAEELAAMPKLKKGCSKCGKKVDPSNPPD